MKVFIILSGLLLPLMLTDTSTAFQKFKPGEGSIELRPGGEVMTEWNRFEAGSYEVEVIMKVTMKYRFSTLLGDHVELFIPKYDVQNVYVFKKGDEDALFGAFLDGTGDFVRYTNSDDAPYFNVGSEVMSKFQMTSMRFRLEKWREGAGSYWVERTFPGYLRGAGKWGWDVPGSKGWGDVMKNERFSYEQIAAQEARVAWTQMALESEPIDDGRLLNATFSVYGLMAAITKKIPDAFKNSEGVSPAFAQMSSLVGQLNQARENGDPELDRREQLTERAWGLLQGEMSSSERKAIEQMRDLADNSVAIEELESLFATIEDDYSDDEELSDSNQSRLEKAITYYTSARLSDLKLPPSVRESLLKFKSAGKKWEEFVATEAPDTEKYGYKDSSGKWVIPPVYRNVGRFINGRAAVERYDADSHNLLIDPDGNQVGSDFDHIFQDFQGMLTCGRSVSGSYNDYGVIDIESGTFLKKPADGSRCELNDLAVIYTEAGGSQKEIFFYDPMTRELFLQGRGLRGGIRDNNFTIVKSETKIEDRCGLDRFRVYANLYDKNGTLLDSNYSYTYSVSSLCLTNRKINE